MEHGSNSVRIPSSEYWQSYQRHKQLRLKHHYQGRFYSKSQIYSFPTPSIGLEKDDVCASQKQEK
jgi:hypothetical protein